VIRGVGEGEEGRREISIGGQCEKNIVSRVVGAKVILKLKKKRGEKKQESASPSG